MTTPWPNVQRLLLGHHALLGGFLRQQLAVGLRTLGDDAVVRLKTLIFYLGGDCLSSGGLSPACALLHLEPTLVRREILGELLWRRQLLAGGGAAGWRQDPSLPQAFPPAEFPWKGFRGNCAPLEGGTVVF
jgi:hypothetical protein